MSTPAARCCSSGTARVGAEHRDEDGRRRGDDAPRRRARRRARLGGDGVPRERRTLDACFRARLISDDEVDARSRGTRASRCSMSANLARGAARQPRVTQGDMERRRLHVGGQQERVSELNDSELEAARRRPLLGDEAALAGRFVRVHPAADSLAAWSSASAAAAALNSNIARTAPDGLAERGAFVLRLRVDQRASGGTYAAIGSPSSACSCALDSSPPRVSTITSTASTATAARIFVRVLTVRTARPGPGRRRRTASRGRSARRGGEARAGA